MGFSGQSGGHLAGAGDPGKAGPGKGLDQRVPVSLRAAQAYRLKVLLPAPQHRQDLLSRQALDRHVCEHRRQLQLHVLLRQQGAEGRFPLLRSAALQNALQLVRIAPQRQLRNRAEGPGPMGLRGSFQNRKKAVAEGADVRHLLGVQIDHLAGGTKQLLRRDQMLSQRGQLPVRNRAGKISEAEPVPPFDQTGSRRGKAPHRRNRRLSAPDDDPVGKIGKPLDCRHVGGRRIKHVEIVPQQRLDFQQGPEKLHRKPVVRLRQLEQIDIPGDQPLRNGKCRQPICVSRGDMEENA